MAQEEYVFDDNHKKKSKMGGMCKFIWNSETKEFCGRDGASWGKVSFFYCIFYFFLGSFFIGMLAVFVQVMPVDKPTYYGMSSIMNARGCALNPGLGFRPQIDPEDNLIRFSPKIKEGEFGFERHFKNLKFFLDDKYQKQNESIKCVDEMDYTEELKNGKACEFDYKKIFESTPCTENNHFGFNTNTPCILIKLNKIISWEPVSSNRSIIIKCTGETSVDKDNVKKVTYHSENSLNNQNAAQISTKYYPFFGQKNYRAPFVWVQFELTANMLVNIECKAFADNIDNTDRLNRRGLTKVSLYLSTK